MQKVFFLSYFIPVISAVVVVCLIENGLAQARSSSSVRHGGIRGRVVDADTRSPLAGTSVSVVETDIGTVADASGYFHLTGLPVGNYSLRFTHIGYVSLMKADVTVKPGRITSVNVELVIAAIPGKGIRVTSSYFPLKDRQPTSAIRFSSAEIRRSPAIAADVSRVTGGLPSLSRYDDRFNNPVVRGGNPIENGYIVDNIEMRNINHYSSPGSPGGVIGLLNVDLIKELDFYSGGFPVQFGDKLSSFMVVTYREGNREEFDGQVELNVSGFGLTAEGPIAGGRGSWLFSARRGFLDLLLDILQIDTAPKHWDIHSKTVFDVTPNNQLVLSGIIGSSAVAVARDNADFIGGSNYGDAETSEWDIGLTWRCLWNPSGYTNLSVSHSSTTYDYFSRWVNTDSTHYINDSRVKDYVIRMQNHYRFSESVRLDFGATYKFEYSELDQYYAAYTDVMNFHHPALPVRFDENNRKLGAFAGVCLQPFDRLTVVPGVRVDYFSYNENYYLSPRLSFSFRIARETSLNGSAGIFRQNMPLAILAQDSTTRNLGDPHAYHFVLGISHLFADDIKFSAEFYDKEYRNFLMDEMQPQLFIIDELIRNYGFPLSHSALSEEGRAYSRGLEFILQKKLSGKFYGLIGGSYFRARYRDYDGIWHDRITDNRVILSFEGGYRPDEKWEFNLRWDYAGGRPYTPYDSALSREYNHAIYDPEQINAVRTPDYHTMSVRIDRRFNFSRSNLSIHFSIWNLYDRKNVAGYSWDKTERQSEPMHQLRILPVFGLEYEF